MYRQCQSYLVTNWSHHFHFEGLHKKLFCTGTAREIEGRKWMGQGKYGLTVLKECKVLCRSNIYMRHQNAKDFPTAHHWLWYMGWGCHTHRRTNLNWIVLCGMKLFVPMGNWSSSSLSLEWSHSFLFSWMHEWVHHLTELVRKTNYEILNPILQIKLARGFTTKADQTASVCLGFITCPNWRLVWRTPDCLNSVGWPGKNALSLLTGTDSDLQLLQDDLYQEDPHWSLFSLFHSLLQGFAPVCYT